MGRGLLRRVPGWRRYFTAEVGWRGRTDVLWAEVLSEHVLGDGDCKLGGCWVMDVCMERVEAKGYCGLRPDANFLTLTISVSVSFA